MCPRSGFPSGLLLSPFPPHQPDILPAGRGSARRFSGCPPRPLPPSVHSSARIPWRPHLPQALPGFPPPRLQEEQRPHPPRTARRYSRSASRSSAVLKSHRFPHSFSPRRSVCPGARPPSPFRRLPVLPRFPVLTRLPPPGLPGHSLREHPSPLPALGKAVLPGRLPAPPPPRGRRRPQPPAPGYGTARLCPAWFPFSGAALPGSFSLRAPAPLSSRRSIPASGFPEPAVFRRPPSACPESPCFFS